MTPEAAPPDGARRDLAYVGFWARTWAAVIDSALLLVAVVPLLLWIYGDAYLDPQRTGWFAGPADVLLSVVAPAVVTVLFWLARQATPGKMVIGACVVDARSGLPLTFNQSVIRYLGYYVALLPFGLGILWVAFDPRKQGWHDKIAGTVVVRPAKGDAPVVFERPADR